MEFSTTSNDQIVGHLKPQFRKLPFEGRRPPRAVDAVAPSHSRPPHKTTQLNESYSNSVLYIAQMNESISVYLNASSASRRIHATKSSRFRPPHITTQLNESYFHNVLYEANHPKSSADPGYETEPASTASPVHQFDYRDQHKSTTLALILVGIIIAVVVILFLRPTRKPTCIAARAKQNSDMEEKGVRETHLVNEENTEQAGEVANGSGWTEIDLQSNVD